MINLINCIEGHMRQGKIPLWEEIDFMFSDSPHNAKKIFNSIVELDFIHHFISPQLQELILFNHNKIQSISSTGKADHVIDLDKKSFELSLEVVAFRNHQEWNYRHPFCSFDLKLGEQKFRLTLLHHSLSPDGHSRAYFRVIKNEPFKIEDFCTNDQQKMLINEMIEQKSNMIICGSTGSGKTSLLSSMANLINGSDHLVLIEDLAEINLNHPHQTRMVARGVSKEDELKNFCAYALRTSPDRILLGEIRSHEVIPYILAMNTGHKGLMSTLHANGPHEAIERLALLFSLYSQSKELSYNTVLKLMAKNINHVIYIENKKIKQIAKILGSDNGHVFFEMISENMDNLID